MKRNLSTIFLILVFFIGLSLLLYPSVSDYWNSLHQSRAIATYASAVAEIDETDYDRLWQAARAYNDNMRSHPNAHVMSEAEQADYLEQLDVSGNGIMGYIEIPEIRCTLPIYHGVDEAVLQIAVGHIDWTSLPVGGEGTHCVLSGHRGLPSAKLFTNLDQLEKGDLFMLRVLDETLSYEVDQILIVEPRDVSALEPKTEAPAPAVETADPGETEIPDYLLAPEMEMPAETVEDRDYIGVLELPALGLSLPVLSRWSYPALKEAPCRYTGSAYQGDLIIAGHNYRSHFGGLKNLTPGDVVRFRDVDGNTFAYTVAEVETLDKYAVEEMQAGDWDLTLFTCTIGGAARVTVRCTADNG